MTSKYLVKEQLAARYGIARFKLLQMGHTNMRNRSRILAAIEAIVGKGSEQQLLDAFLRPEPEQKIDRVHRKEYHPPLDMRQAAVRARAFQPELITINGRVRHEYI
jgi:hypothetical protein